MSEEITEVIYKTDGAGEERQLVLQCAPLIAGLKMSSLLLLEGDQLQRLKSLMGGGRFDCLTLCAAGARTAVFLYDRRQLERLLDMDGVRRFLSEAGYTCLAVEGVLEKFRRRYREYVGRRGRFPHELGVLLGYPLEDVEGYIRNRGKNFLYTGYWKVYHNVPDKADMFRLYELSHKMFFQLLKNGVTPGAIVETYGGEHERRQDNI